MIRRVLFAVLLLTGMAAACYQIDNPTQVVKSNYLSGRVTLDGRPLGAKLSLEQEAPFEGKFTVHPHRQVIATTRTDAKGEFSFGRLKPGLYVLVMSGPSYETTYVSLQDPGNGAYQKLALIFKDDFCKYTGTY